MKRNPGVGAKERERGRDTYITHNKADTSAREPFKAFEKKPAHLRETLEADLSILLPRTGLEAWRLYSLSLRRGHLLRVTATKQRRGWLADI